MRAHATFRYSATYQNDYYTATARTIIEGYLKRAKMEKKRM